VYYGFWYFIGGQPIVSFAAVNSGVITGNGTWQYLGPTVYCPYPKMNVAVRFGAKLDAPPATTVLGCLGPGSFSGQAAGEGPSIMELEAGTSSGVTATVSSFSYANLGFAGGPESLAHFGACTAGKVYRHSYRWTEMTPMEIQP
jgi:hypothetical protein